MWSILGSYIFFSLLPLEELKTTVSECMINFIYQKQWEINITLIIKILLQHYSVWIMAIKYVRFFFFSLLLCHTKHSNTEDRPYLLTCIERKVKLLKNLELWGPCFLEQLIRGFARRKARLDPILNSTHEFKVQCVNSHKVFTFSFFAERIRLTHQITL